MMVSSLGEALRRRISMKMKQEAEQKSIVTKETSIINSKESFMQNYDKIVVDMAKQSDLIVDMVDSEFFERKKAKTPMAR